MTSSPTNGPRGAVVFWSWALVVVSAVLFAGFLYTTFVGSIFID